jgi:uncharacterized OsmC-like protein
MVKLRDLLIERRRSRHRRPRNQPQTTAPTIVTAQVRAEGCSGLRHIQIRDFQLFNDMGPDCAGFDLGPTQFELLLGALGSCLTQSFLDQAAEQGVSVAHVEVDVTGRTTAPGGATVSDQIAPTPGDIRYAFKVDSAASAEEIERVRFAVEQTCPILNLLVQPQSIRGTMVHALGATPKVTSSPN